MQIQQTNVGSDRDNTLAVLEQETADIDALIDEIWSRFTSRATNYGGAAESFESIS
jgi:hypothetical protein